MTRRRSIWAVALLTLLAAGCGSTTSTSSGGAGSAASAGSAYPVTIDNCGVSETFTAAPTRVVTTFQPTLELLLALGLGDHVIGREAYTESPILPAQLAAYNKIPEISKPSTVPPKEVMLSQRPDFVIAEDSNADFDTSQGLATRQDLEGVVAKVFIESGRCTPEHQATFQDDYNDLTNLGKIFNVPDKAQSVINAMKAKIAAVQAKIQGRDPVPLIFYDYKTGPLSLMTTGMSEVLQTGGAKNLTTATTRNEVDVSVETAVAQNPKIILLWDYGDKTNGDSITYLKSALATTDAVKNNKLIPIKGSETFPGIRSADGVGIIAAICFPDLFPNGPPCRQTGECT